MILLQLLEEVPDWAKERGLNEKSFELLEEIAISPDSKDKILAKVEYGTACGILNALEYAQDKGLI
jgi:hypothetical protein